MFRRVAVDVEVVGGDVTFRFTSPLSLTTLVVVSEDTGRLWEVLAEEMKPLPIPAGRVTGFVMPLSQAPPEMLALLKRVEAEADRRLQQNGPTKPPISSVSYGTVPVGYRQTVEPAVLLPGEYRVLVFSEQGHGSGAFRVPAA